VALAALDASLRLIVEGGRLPRSSSFQLPAVVPCRGGCREDIYCSTGCEMVRAGGCDWAGVVCALLANMLSAVSWPQLTLRTSSLWQVMFVESQAAWDAHHKLLCLGGGGNGGVDTEALQRFKRHADASNDIFHVAARAVVGACLRAQQLLGPGWWVPAGLPPVNTPPPHKASVADPLPAWSAHRMRCCPLHEQFVQLGDSILHTTPQSWVAPCDRVSVADLRAWSAAAGQMQTDTSWQEEKFA
jgi:hypothetical protein